VQLLVNIFNVWTLDPHSLIARDKLNFFASYIRFKITHMGKNLRSYEHSPNSIRPYLSLCTQLSFVSVTSTNISTSHILKGFISWRWLLGYYIMFTGKQTFQRSVQPSSLRSRRSKKNRKAWILATMLPESPTPHLTIRDVFNHRVTGSFKNKYSCTFYTQSTSTTKILMTKEPINNRFAVALGF
jgi:hypothetical protein